jgi:hypothetical protein
VVRRARYETLSRGERRCRQSFGHLSECWPAASSPHEEDHHEGPEGQQGQPRQGDDRGDEALIADLHAPNEVRYPSGGANGPNPSWVDTAESECNAKEEQGQSDQDERQAVDPDLDPADRLGGAKRPPPAGQALAQASTARFSATPSTAWRMVNEAPVVIAAARPKRVTAAAASGLIGIEK